MIPAKSDPGAQSKQPTGGPRCIYCGTDEDLTSDHVPPKCLFPSPRPANLITVPACNSCNASFSKDDEYFRVFAISQATLDPAWESFWQEKVIGSTLKRSPALRHSLAQSIVPVELMTPAGNCAGRTEALCFDRERINRIVTRIIRALVWHHYHVSLATEVEFTIKTAQELGAQFRTILDLVRSATHVDVRLGPVFRYRWGRAVEDPDQSIWFLGFYDAIILVVIISRAMPVPN